MELHTCVNMFVCMYDVNVRVENLFCDLKWHDILGLLERILFLFKPDQKNQCL